YSLGARVALGLLAAAPARFRRALLIGARAGLAAPSARGARRDADARWIAQLTQAVDDPAAYDAFFDAWSAQPLFATQARLSEAARAAQDDVRRRHDPRGLAAALAVLGLGNMPDLRPALPTFDRPVRLLVGADDVPFHAAAEAMAAQLPDARVAHVPAAGHNLLLETPAAVAAALMEA
ncbi:MAG: alpha/beta fold hydrolase, partial [Acidobacteriota bacterium]